MSAGDKIDDMEAHIEKLDLELIRLRTKMEEHQETVRDIDSKLDSILNEISRYKGFLGGIVEWIKSQPTENIETSELYKQYKAE